MTHSNILACVRTDVANNGAKIWMHVLSRAIDFDFDLFRKRKVSLPNALDKAHALRIYYWKQFYLNELEDIQ